MISPGVGNIFLLFFSFKDSLAEHCLKCFAMLYKVEIQQWGQIMPGISGAQTEMKILEELWSPVYEYLHLCRRHWSRHGTILCFVLVKCAYFVLYGILLL